MARDLYQWAFEDKQLSKNDIFNIKQDATKRKISEAQALMDAGVATKDEIMTALNKIYGLKIYSGDILSIEPIKEIPITESVENKFIVIIENQDNTTENQDNGKNKEKIPLAIILIVNPKYKLIIQDKLKNMLGKVRIEFQILMEDDFNAWVLQNAGLISNTEMSNLTEDLNIVTTDEDTAIEEDEEEDAATITNITNKIIIDAAKQGASDVHIEPMEHNTKLRVRMDGVLKDNGIIAEKAVYRQVVSRLKVMAQLDINNFRTPQSGKIRIKTKTAQLDTRISTMPTIFGEKVTIRILESNNKIRTLEELGINKQSCSLLRDMMSQPNGIILVSGPTGSGKSSTLAAMLSELNSTQNCLITIEDPVEYRIQNATQVNVNVAQGLTFPIILREVLRQDPDIIMVGEMRDLETAQTGVQAANTGHLVFTTIHTNNAASTLTRLTNMGVDSYLVADSIVGILNQQLLRKVCPSCRQEHILTEQDIEKYNLDKKLIGSTIYESSGCARCGNTGYKGRTVITEIIKITDNIIKLVYENASVIDIENKAIENGMQTKSDSALELVLNGTTTIKEVIRVLGGFNT